jgi:hypothetical protein
MARTSRCSSLQSPVDLIIEAVCQRGCRYVLETIAQLDRGEVPAGLISFEGAEQQAVLAELKSIMAVYGDD